MVNETHAAMTTLFLLGDINLFAISVCVFISMPRVDKLCTVSKLTGNGAEIN
jgi:hypothetical protein